MLKKFKSCHIRVEATISVNHNSSLVARVATSFNALRVPHDIRYKSWELADTRRSVVVNS